MKTMSLLYAGAFTLALTGQSIGAMGKAKIMGTAEDSDIRGEIKLEETKDGLKITGDLENIPVGEHAFHIHEFGDCGEEGKLAGSHYNPTQSPHGHIMKDGMKKAHIGDLGNIVIGTDGSGHVDAVIPNLHLTGGKYNVAGRAFIIHDKKDDFGQPTGNAGGRIGCGPIVLTEK
jgi:Cu-Zn family superoxide dismutase